MSSPAESAPLAEGSVAEAVDSFRDRLAHDSFAFTQALLALARSNAHAPGSFNHASPQRKAAQRVLARWQRDAHHALARIRATPPHAADRTLAVKWLEALISAQSVIRKGLSLTDPKAADHASRLAQKRIAESNRIEAILDRKLA